MIKRLAPYLLGLFVGLCCAGGIVYFMISLGNVDAPPPALSDPMTKKIVESKVSNRGLPEKWPGNEIALWGEGQGPYYGDTGGLIIWDSSNNERRKVFRIREAVRKVRGEPNRRPPIANVFISPGDRVQIPLQPGTYEVYAISGREWNSGFDESAEVVSYGYVFVYQYKPSVIAIGAPDQPVTFVDRDWF